MQSEKAKEAIVLDFDGVICDSFHERVRVAYQASLQKWPEVMKKVVLMNVFIIFLHHVLTTSQYAGRDSFHGCNHLCFENLQDSNKCACL